MNIGNFDMPDKYFKPVKDTGLTDMYGKPLSIGDKVKLVGFVEAHNGVIGKNDDRQIGVYFATNHRIEWYLGIATCKRMIKLD